MGSRCETVGRPTSGSGAQAGGPEVPKMLPLRADLLLCNTLFEELDSGISADALRQLTGRDNLEEVDFLEMQVDAVSGSQRVETLGELLPNLTELRLNQSAVCSIRDLGISYRELRVLSLRQSQLQDLGGIVALSVLEELYISFNDVRDLSPLCTHDALQVLDVEGNLIEDFEDIGGLQSLYTLRELTLNSNPVCKSEGFSRERVLEVLPQIEVLNDIMRGEKESEDFQVSGIDTTVLDDVEEDSLEDIRDAGEPPPYNPWLTGGDETNALRDLRRRAAPDKDEELKSSPEPSDTDEPYSEAVQELRKGRAQLRLDVSGESFTKDPHTEPSEQELIVENLKRARPPLPNIWSLKANTARSASSEQRPFTGFCPDRRGLRTAWCAQSSGSGSSTTYRPSSGTSGYTSSTAKTSSTAAQSAVPEDSDPNASELTMGDEGSALAGNALAAIRRRRKVAKERGEEENGIRDMLRRFQTYTQESCLSEAELDMRRRQSGMKRPGTSDVRVSAPRLLTANGRPMPASLPGAPAERGIGTPKKRPSLDGRPSSRKGLDLADDYTAPTFSTEAGEALIIE